MYRDITVYIMCVCLTVSMLYYRSMCHVKVASPPLCSCRDSVMEILFEQDNEEKSVASLILDALVKVQNDYRLHVLRPEESTLTENRQKYIQGLFFFVKTSQWETGV